MSENIRILFLGEVVGIPTIKSISGEIDGIIRDNRIDLVIANADGVSDGYGILKSSAIGLNRCGIRALTCGDFVFNKRDVKELLGLDFLVRPYNLPDAHGGKGILVLDDVKGQRAAVVSILGRVNFGKIFASDPFRSADEALKSIDKDIKIRIVDFHGGATSEIQAMQWHLAGRASLVAGSHLRILTTDNRVIDGGTAVITGLGFCGGYESIGGLEPDLEIKKIKNGQFAYSKIASEDHMLQGVICETDPSTGRSLSIEIFKHKTRIH